MKYPVCYIYKKTSDKGRELRYSLRSLKNVKNWNGQVFVAGDKEDWFSNQIIVIDSFKRSHIKGVDGRNRLRAAIKDTRLADDFIFMNDDFFITKPTAVKPLHQGEIDIQNPYSRWLKGKERTKSFLKALDIEKPLDYDIHVPMVMGKVKIKLVLDVIAAQPHGQKLMPRTLYGNLFRIGGELYKDRKTTTSKLLKGEFVSTKLYTDELEKLFPDKSEFEI